MSCIFTKIIFFLLVVVVAILGTISENVHFQYLARDNFKAIHIRCSHLGIVVFGEFNNRVAFVLTCVGIFGEFNCIYLAKS